MPALTIRFKKYAVFAFGLGFALLPATAFFVFDANPMFGTLALGAGAVGVAGSVFYWQFRRSSATLLESERRYREVEARYRCLIEQAAVAMFVFGPDDRILDANAQASLDLGYTREELLSLTFKDVLKYETEREGEFGNTKTRECLYRKKNGTTAPVEARLGGVGGQIGGMWVAVVRDITRRRREEAALRESERRFRDTLERGRLLAVCLDLEGAVTFCNDSFLTLTGFRRADVVGRNWFEVFKPSVDGAEAARRYRDGVREGKLPAHRECTILTRAGQALRISLNSTLLRDPEGRPTGVSELGEDVTDRLRTEEALREREQLLQTVLAHIPCGVYWKDRDGRYLGCNGQVAHDLGLASPADAVGKTDGELQCSGERIHHHTDLSVVLTGKATLNEEESCDGTGERSRFLLSSRVPLCDQKGSVVGVLGMYQDITERKRLEDNYRQSQKMEAVGQLAGGIAHDFNNLLTVINGYSQLLEADGELNSQGRLFANAIHTAGDRAALLTRQLLAFSRRQVLKPIVMSLNSVVTETVQLLDRLLEENIKLTTELAPDICRVSVDAGQLQQVLMNLTVNARDAMPTGGRLMIMTRSVRLTQDEISDIPEALPGEYAELAVSDTGCGMTSEVLEHLFEPFFTTKDVGKGTGLGLATAFGIVSGHGGHIRVDSEPSRGTTFRVYLPAAPESMLDTVLEADALQPQHEASETVLLAEDEPGVRSLTARILRTQGYEVLEAADGEEAIRLAGQHPGPIDLLVTDVVMPRRGGRETAEAIRKSRPGLKVIFISGYTDDAVVRNGVLHDNVNFLQKPFSPASLVQEVRERLIDTE